MKVTIDRELLERAASMELDTTARSIRIQDELRAILANPTQQGEAVAIEPKPLDVVGYASPGQIEILRNLPRPVGMKVKGSKDDRYSEPVVLLKDARAALISLAARCQQEGAFKACLECGYQDGHDEICQFHATNRKQGQPSHVSVVPRELLEGLVAHIEGITCTHDNTHRGGAIWEICDDCGDKWADDRGGKPAFKWPECVEKAYALLYGGEPAGQYNRKRIGWELERTAMGDGYYGNALRVAKDIPGLTDQDRAVLDRYATGAQHGTDHIALQDIAMRVYATQGEGGGQ